MYVLLVICLKKEGDKFINGLIKEFVSIFAKVL